MVHETALLCVYNASVPCVSFLFAEVTVSHCVLIFHIFFFPTNKYHFIFLHCILLLKTWLVSKSD